MLLQNVSHTDLVDALAGSGVHGLSGGELNGLAVVLELFQQPDLELVSVINGQLGHDVMLELEKRGYEAIGSDRAGDDNAPFKVVALDITDKEKRHNFCENVIDLT